MLGRLYKANTLDVYEINTFFGDGRRQFTDEKLADLDPQGWHVLQPIAYGDMDVVRCLTYFKVSDEDKPTLGVIDVPAEYLRNLMIVNHPEDFPKVYEGMCKQL